MTDSMIRMGTMLVTAAVIGAGSGCGLISSDVTNFDLTLPEKQFTIDADGWQLDAKQAEALLSTSCAGAPEVCATAAEQACQDGCSGSCSDTTQQCELALAVSLYRSIDLLNERPELKAIDDEPLIKVTIDSITYEITSNTLNFDTPALTVYVAPTSVMDPADPQATPIGTIEPVPAGILVTPKDLTFTATGRADLIAAMNNFRSPFNIIVGSTLVVDGDSPVPAGKLDAVVRIRAHAGL
jgi:hypothetical protein